MNEISVPFKKTIKTIFKFLLFISFVASIIYFILNLPSALGMIGICENAYVEFETTGGSGFCGVIGVLAFTSLYLKLLGSFFLVYLYRSVIVGIIIGIIGVITSIIEANKNKTSILKIPYFYLSTLILLFGMRMLFSLLFLVITDSAALTTIYKALIPISLPLIVLAIIGLIYSIKKTKKIKESEEKLG